MSNHSEVKPGGELLMYHTNDGATPIRVLLDGDTVWLTQKLLAELYHVGVNTINHHFYREYTRNEYRTQQSRASSGDFYNNQSTRVGRLFASRVIHAAKEGRIGFKEAYDLCGLYGGSFQRYARRLGLSLP